jgi:pimeloyl-ACP methyl ester carboxylesterase
MQRVLFVLLLLTSLSTAGQAQTVQHVPSQVEFDEYYLVEPRDSIQGVLILLPGFGQPASSIFPETKLHNVAYVNGILVLGIAGGAKMYADSIVQSRISKIGRAVIERYGLDPSKVVIGGFSAGGTIALRYVELCHQYPERYPIRPRGVFMVDSPIDIFTIWDMLEETRAINFSEVAVTEANWALGEMEKDRGIPKQNVARYAEVNPFSMYRLHADNEVHLKSVAVRAYHDVDIAWRLINRRQPVRNSNYEMTAELINRLLLLGNERAEFIQATGKGFRSNGMRHPHSWSIVDEVECVQWMKSLMR